MKYGTFIHCCELENVWHSVDSIEKLIDKLLLGLNPFPKHELVILPPFIYCDLCNQLLNDSQIKLGAQNVAQYNVGAYTGEIAASNVTRQ